MVQRPPHSQGHDNCHEQQVADGEFHGGSRASGRSASLRMMRGLMSIVGCPLERGDDGMFWSIGTTLGASNGMSSSQEPVNTAGPTNPAIIRLRRLYFMGTSLLGRIRGGC